MGSKPYRSIIGLMSGTSLDGLDVGYCEIHGYGSKTSLELKAFETIPFPEKLRDQITQIFCKAQVDLALLTLLHAYLGRWYADKVDYCLDQWQVKSHQIDCIASHGQTIFHAPKRLHQIDQFPNATFQIVDGDHIAHHTGIITISDFRQKNVAMGGEGAPLALYGDYLLFSNPTQDRLLLNIGGISNFTFLPKNRVLDKVICTDVGPGNTLIDQAMGHYFSKALDHNGDMARSGQCHHTLLDKWLAHPFFEEGAPKTTGQETFSWDWICSTFESDSITPKDLICTLTHFTVKAIVYTIKKQGIKKTNNLGIYVGGGGVHNSYMMELLRQEGYSIEPMDHIGMRADAKEAALFAVLANETICGSDAFGDTLLGKISLP